MLTSCIGLLSYRRGIVDTLKHNFSGFSVLLERDSRDLAIDEVERVEILKREVL